MSNIYYLSHYKTLGFLAADSHPPCPHCTLLFYAFNCWQDIPPPQKKLFKTLISSNFTHSATVILNCLCLTLTVFFEAQIILCQVILCQVFFSSHFLSFYFQELEAVCFVLLYYTRCFPQIMCSVTRKARTVNQLWWALPFQSCVWNAVNPQFWDA